MRSFFFATLLLVGCGTHGSSAMVDMAGPNVVAPDPRGIPIAADPQRPGDPQVGYDALVNNGYVRCGIPYSIYSRFFQPAPAAQQIPGRTGHNANLPYSQTAFKVASGVEVVSANCLACHAGTVAGKLVIGLGNTDQDYTVDPSMQAMTAQSLAPMLTADKNEQAEVKKWAGRVIAIGPYTTVTTLGVNPGDNFAAVLLAHRDPATLAWSDTPLLELPPMYGVPVDVPPWWRMKKKNSMFYTDAGHGDHARIEMAAANLCTDNVAEAMMIDSYFPDIEAYLASIEPPAWPFPVDQALAKQGRTVFEATCAQCHGTYGGGGGDGGKYQNLLIPLEVVNSDPVLAVGSAQFATRFLDWWSKSFFGAVSTLAPKQGYVAPPLDGIWATAPYLHNGSVPTIAALLDSTKRPTYWTRTFDSNDYDQKSIGWNFTQVDHGKATEPDDAQKKKIYDTTTFGYGNGGHTFGDGLSEADRGAVLEYLKTL